MVKNWMSLRRQRWRARDGSPLALEDALENLGLFADLLPQDGRIERRVVRLG